MGASRNWHDKRGCSRKILLIQHSSKRRSNVPLLGFWRNLEEEELPLVYKVRDREQINGDSGTICV